MSKRAESAKPWGAQCGPRAPRITLPMCLLQPGKGTGGPSSMPLPLLPHVAPCNKGSQAPRASDTTRGRGGGGRLARCTAASLPVARVGSPAAAETVERPKGCGSSLPARPRAPDPAPGGRRRGNDKAAAGSRRKKPLRSAGCLGPPPRQASSGCC